MLERISYEDDSAGKKYTDYVLPSLIERSLSELAMKAAQDIDERIEAKFLEMTGEKLSEDNMSRIQVITFPYNKDGIEQYRVDGKYMMSVGPLRTEWVADKSGHATLKTWREIQE